MESPPTRPYWQWYERLRRWEPVNLDTETQSKVAVIAINEKHQGVVKTRPSVGVYLWRTCESDYYRVIEFDQFAIQSAREWYGEFLGPVAPPK